MKFLIRDDDPCAFTRPSELINCYQHIWDDVPINFSVTPFRIPGNDRNVPQRYKGFTNVMPLSGNDEIVQFFKSMLFEGKIDIAMHGYFHSKEGGLPEYIGGTDLNRRTRDGKRYLEEILGCKISTFIPPNNSIGRKGLQALLHNSLNLIGIPSLVRPYRRAVTFSGLIKFPILKYYHFIHRIPYPYVLSIHGHKEVAFCPVTPSQRMDRILYHFDKVRKLDGVFIIAVHYHAFNKKLKSGELIRDVLNSIVEKADALGNVQFCTYRQLWGAQ